MGCWHTSSIGFTWNAPWQYYSWFQFGINHLGFTSSANRNNRYLSIFVCIVQTKNYPVLLYNALTFSQVKSSDAVVLVASDFQLRFEITLFLPLLYHPCSTSQIYLFISCFYVVFMCFLFHFFIIMFITD